jgi:hypothetical protein
MPHSIRRPHSGEYSPYFNQYLNHVPDGDVLEMLASQLEETASLLGTLRPEMGDHRYAPGKWSIKEVVSHVIDVERVFAYRALRISRNDATPLPGFEQEDYVREGNAASRTLEDLVAELRAVRVGSLALFRGMNEDMLGRRGVASGAELSVRAVPWILAGHERHHLNLLRERYLA